jgi:hypothetical protein
MRRRRYQLDAARDPSHTHWCKGKRLRNAKEDNVGADNALMHKQDIQIVVEGARETADAIVGAREWRTVEDAGDMRDVIFWDLLSKQLPDMTVAEIMSTLDAGGVRTRC